MGNRKYTEKLVFIALLVALSVVLGFVDKYLSAFIPTQGVRLGLANIVILTGIYYLSVPESLLLIILKSVLTGLLLGNPMTFLIGLAGTLLSYLVMILLIRLGKNKISLVGVSVSGGVAHNIGQVLMLINFYTWTVVFNLIWLIPMGLGTGLFIGYVVRILKNYLDKGHVFKTITFGECKDIINLIDSEDERD